MDLPNVGWAATEKYCVSTIPLFMIKLPGRLKLIRAPSIPGPEALVEWARSTMGRLSEEDKQRAVETSGQKVPKAHEVPKDYVYRFTDPETGVSVDLRTQQPWVDASEL